MNRIVRLILISIFVLSAICFSQDFPLLTKYVTDNASILSINEYKHIDSLCKSIYADEIAQVIILIEKELPNTALKYSNVHLYATDVFNKNKIGRKNIDDGILIFVALAQRKISIVNGYLIGDIVPDSTTSRIIREVIGPQFRNSAYAKGLLNGIEELKNEIIRRKRYMYPEKSY